MSRPTSEGREGSDVNYPQDLRYTKQHEWVRDEGDGRARVGITDYAQDALGDVVYVDLPETGTEVSAGQAFGEVESTKLVFDVCSPVTGTVIERNAALEDRPELVNSEPYGDGWMIAVQAETLNLDELLDAAAYEAHVQQEQGH